MDLNAAGLVEQPFRTHGRPPAVVSYASHRLGLKVLKETLIEERGLAMLQGSSLSGKSTLIRQFIDALADTVEAAVVDAKGLNTTGLYEAVLRQFGYELDYTSPNELLGMIRVFAVQQTGSQQAPLLVIENANALRPSAWRGLCELAALKTGRTSALKLVLVSNRSLRHIIDDPALTSIANRVTHDFHLHPMSEAEAYEYVGRKLRAAGSDDPESIFPKAVCGELWSASGGWPGILDRIALLALAKAENAPISIELIERPVLPKPTWTGAANSSAATQSNVPPAPPTLYVSRHGKTLREFHFDSARLLVGRSEQNDIAIDSTFVSRHHLLIVRHGAATYLMDLHSTNGTFINSERVSHKILVHGDVINLGHHRITFVDPSATSRRSFDSIDIDDTAIMQIAEDLGLPIAEMNGETSSLRSDDLPIAGA